MADYIGTDDAHSCPYMYLWNPITRGCEIQSLLLINILPLFNIVRCECERRSNDDFCTAVSSLNDLILAHVSSGELLTGCSCNVAIYQSYACVSANQNAWIDAMKKVMEGDAYKGLDLDSLFAVLTVTTPVSL